MRKLLILLLITSLILCCSCAHRQDQYDIVATTLPVYEFTSTLTQNTDLCVGQLITENVSCLHDYTLQVHQMQMIENANVIVISGLGLEDFLDDALSASRLIVDASCGVHTHDAGHNHDHDLHVHSNEDDPHIWLSPENAMIMAENIYNGLCNTYPEYQDTFAENMTMLVHQLQALEAYGEAQLAELACRELITFHDGFSYFAESFDLSILEAIEEESGSEASAAEIIHLSEMIRERHLPAVFTEVNGSDACAGIICAETEVNCFTLDMAMSGDSYLKAMYHNIDTIKEALG